MNESLDQMRSRFAWKCVQEQSQDYGNLAKSAPALIMTSGLMPLLAYLNDKRKHHHLALSNHLCAWLLERFPRVRGTRTGTDTDFDMVMKALMGERTGDAAADARFYREATEETMNLLRWIRQFAAVVNGKETRNG